MISVQNKKTFGKYLKEGRIESGYTQTEVAHKIGLIRGQFISNIERGLCSPSIKVLKKLISLYDLEPNEVIEILIHDFEVYLKKEFKIK